MVRRVFFNSNDDVNLDTKNVSSLCIRPATHSRPNFYIPAEFGNRVLVHIAKNFIAHSCGVNIPLILAIQGSQGDGKSSQVREVCSRNNIYVYPISGSFLSGSHEKEAVEILAESYINVYSVARDTNCVVAILIDDFDLSVASTFEEREYTVNSQLLTGFLMNLADDPTKCGKENVCRIPIIVTGNNFTSLHDPLTRHGRMDFFTWLPTLEQKLEIVKHMYQSCTGRENLDKISQLVYEFRDEPVSFFDSLKSDYLNDVICKNIEESGGLNMAGIERVARNAFSQGINLACLRKLAVQRKATQRRDYIKRSDGKLNNQTHY
jgi:ATPase family associated with various cellular activities (AAA)